MRRGSLICGIVLAIVAVATVTAEAEEVPALRVGRVGHAFDHLGTIGDQAPVAAASGATVIYATGLGGHGYAGLPADAELATLRDAVSKYNRDARRQGIELVLGYVCATSIVKLEMFDKNWTDELRAQFKTSPAEWRQRDRNGQPLASWYGGDYYPACMNNPDWRKYEEFMVRQQLEGGHDGIFFDNPTVHPQGCYCEHCMDGFAKFVEDHIPAVKQANDASQRRNLAVAHPQEFIRFRATIGRDFLDHIRRFARTINPNALITCNNSLNSPQVLFSQSRAYGYNIFEMSKVEDLVVVEDMVAQPRVEADGRTFEYGPTYKQLQAISHGKPIVAVTLAGGDYHTPPNLVRLAMAEAAANGASYLSWPTWPEEQRERMITGIRPQADWLRSQEAILNDAESRADVVLFLPFRRWVDVDHCTASDLAAALSAANVQYRVMSDEDFDPASFPTQSGVLLIETLDVLTPQERQDVERYRESHGLIVTADNPDWLKTAQSLVKSPSIAIEGPRTVRAVVRDQPKRTIVHLLNLDIRKLSSFEDEVKPATNIKLSVRVPFTTVRDVTLHTADENVSAGPIEHKARRDGDETIVEAVVPRVDVSAILVIDG
jgi:hypothetical protein